MRGKKGSLQKTSVGLIEIKDIVIVPEDALTAKHAKMAGFDDVKALLASLRNNDGDLYKITVVYHSADPRIELREKKTLDTQAFCVLKAKLASLDMHSKQGNWTTHILNTIHGHPQKRAVELASLTGYEKEWLKLNIRKLKNLGLTISYEIGYALSPLGRFFLKQIGKGK